MKEQFVTYEIALKLKELECNEPCFAKFYVQNNTDPFLAIGREIDEYDNAGDDIQYDCDAFLWQQAISFLKERKILVTELWDGWEYRAEGWDDFIYCETKEEAILKAIEICQKQK